MLLEFPVRKIVTHHTEKLTFNGVSSILVMNAGFFRREYIRREYK
jgi:hypothetical protein